MAFQDFDHLSERRRAERQQKLKKRITIAAISSLCLAGIIAGAVVAVVQHSGPATKGSNNNNSNNNNGASPSGGTKQLSHSEKAIKMMCSTTDYQQTCKISLEKAAKADPNLSQPKDLLKAAIQSTLEEVESAFNKTKTFKFDTPQEKEAFEYCKTLIGDAMEELGFAVKDVGDFTKLPSKVPDLNNWLSAVITYQQTCVDGFPDGKTNDDMRKALQATRELTSNSLAIISEVVSFVKTFQLPGANRHLQENKPTVDEEGFPSWVAHEDRRILKGKGKEGLPTPNVTVAKDGGGDFKTIDEALKALPQKYNGRYVIYIKEGIYEEIVNVTKKMPNITMYGDGSQKTIITGSLNFADGVKTAFTATFVALGENFMAKAIGFRNTAGPEKHQAVALRVQSDRAIFQNCRFEGYQDTLYVQTHRQFYKSCVISGTVDFIFGDAAVVFQNCLIVVRKPMDNQQNIVTAQGRSDKRETTGIVIQNCRIVAEDKLVPHKTKIKSYLGRPWKEFSRTIIMESEIEDIIDPKGYLPWEGEFALKTLYYAEYNNKGPGSGVSGRVDWPGYKKGIKKEDAAKWTVGTFLTPDWIQASGVPVHLGVY